MTTRSGSNLRAISSASATVPASATTWNALAPIEQRDQPLADDLVVVDDEEPERPGGRSPRERWLRPRASASRVDRDAGLGTRDPDDDTRARGRTRCRPRGAPPIEPTARSRMLTQPVMVAAERPRPGRTRCRCRRSRGRADRRRRCLRRPRSSARVAPGVAGDVAERLAGDLEELDRDLGREPALVERVVSPEVQVDRCVLSAELVGERPRGPPTRSTCASSSGRRPKMKLRMSRIVWWRRVDRPVDPGAAPRPARRPSARARPRATGRRA